MTFAFDSDSSDDDEQSQGQDELDSSAFNQLPTSRHRDNAVINYYTDYKKNKINLEPIYQRGSVWSVERKANFIYQLFRRRMTIPPIQLNDLPEYTNVIDGKQRLLAVFGYIDNEYALKDGKFYSSLTSVERRKFDNCVIGAIVYENLPEDDEIDIFQNLQNGVPLISGEKLLARNDAVAILIKQLMEDSDIFNRDFKRNGIFKHIYMMVLSMIDEKGTINISGKALMEKSSKITSDEVRSHGKHIASSFQRLTSMKNKFPKKYKDLSTLDIIMLGHFLKLEVEKNWTNEEWLDNALRLKKQHARVNDNVILANITQLRCNWRSILYKKPIKKAKK